MKKLLLLPALLGWAHLAAAQHTELLGRAGLNFSRFAGSSAEGTSGVNMYTMNGSGYGYTNNPYSSRPGLGGSLGVRLLHESRFPLLLALDLGYEYQRARTTITSINYYDEYALVNYAYAADGYSHYQTQHLQLFAALGYRLRLGAYRFDLLAGPELATIFGRREAGQGTYNGPHNWTTDVDRSGGPTLDALLRADLTAWRGRFGLNGSYAWGSTNYLAGMLGGGPWQATSRSLRLGLAFRLTPQTAR